MRPVALITGGTRGIGLGIAEALSDGGWDLALCGLRSDDEVTGVTSALARSGASVTYCRADVSVAGDRARLLDDVTARHGRLDALVNNAGRAPSVRADLLDATESSFETLVRTNLQGPYFLTQAAARLILHAKQHGSSRSAIVFITSVSAELASINRGDYCVTKAGLAMAVKLFAARLAADGVPVYEVRPGIVHTDMTAGVKEIYDRRIADGLIPQARWGTPADVGRAVAALLGGELAYSTGSVIHVDGGLSIGRL
jgi:NAD(P)-dependent dehydrogenase (short-subunit alcohol dehydrogenase family)